MIDTLFAWPSVRRRQKEAPLLRERELFLSHLLQQGCSPSAGTQYRNDAGACRTPDGPANASGYSSGRDPDGGERWVHDAQPHITHPVGPTSAVSIITSQGDGSGFIRLLSFLHGRTSRYDESAWAVPACDATR